MNIIKRGKRNVLSRSFHARDNEKAIAAWKLDLNEICRALEVRPFPCELRRLLTFSFQVEPAEKADAGVRNILNTHKNAPGLHGIPNIGNPDVRSDVLNAHDVASRAHRDVVYPDPIVSQAWEGTANGIPPRAHRNMLRNLGDVDGQNRTVSTLVVFIC